MVYDIAKFENCTEDAAIDLCLNGGDPIQYCQSTIKAI